MPRSPLLALVAGALLGALLFFSPSAHAWVRVTDYLVSMTPQGDRVEYSLRIQYQSIGEEHPSGFKIVRGEPRDVRAVSFYGQPLHSEMEHNGVSSWRIRFHLPPPDAHGDSGVILTFSLDAVHRYDWEGDNLDVPWAHVWGINIDRMRVEANLPPRSNPDGFVCAMAAEGRFVHCTRRSDAVAPLRLSLARVGDFEPRSMGAAVVAAMLAVWAVVVALYTRRLRARRGVITTRKEKKRRKKEARRQKAEAQGYRAPPEVPPPGEATLHPDDRKRLLTRVGVATPVMLVSLGAFAFGMTGESPLPMPMLLGIFGAVVLGLCVLYLTLEERRLGWVAIPVAVSAASFFGWIAIAVALFGTVVFATVIELSLRYGGQGGDSDGGSSCSSGSSCGGSSCGGSSGCGG